MTRSTSYNTLHRALSPPPAEPSMSDPGHGQQRSSTPARNTFVQENDIAAQARAATEALKGPDQGVSTPPRRSRVLSRSKSAKKLNKAISGPQLISTSQRLDHASLISSGDPSLTAKGVKPYQPRKSSTTAIFSGGMSPKSSPERRRTSERSGSFGENGSPSTPARQHTQPTLMVPSSEPIRPSKSMTNLHAAAGDMKSSGSLSRLMSKLGSRNRRTSEAPPAIIEPYPLGDDIPPVPSLNQSRAVTPISTLAEAFPTRRPQSGITMAIPGATPPLRSAAMLTSPFANQSPESLSTPVWSPPRKSSLNDPSPMSADHETSEAAPPLPSEPAYVPAPLTFEAPPAAPEEVEELGEVIMDGTSLDHGPDRADARDGLNGNRDSSVPHAGKSARDTIVRRTLIVPARAIDLSDDRRKVSGCARSAPNTKLIRSSIPVCHVHGQQTTLAQA